MQLNLNHTRGVCADMEQKEYIERCIKQSVARAGKTAEIQAAYQKYAGHPAQVAFADLILLLDAYCTPWVRKQLSRTGCYCDENEHTVLQNARLAVWEAITKDVESGSLRDSFAFYAFGIYKKKALDVIRKVTRIRVKIDVRSISEPIGYEGKTLEDDLPPVQPDFGELEEQRSMYEKIFHTYCVAFLTSKAFPPRCLALYYARVLPHLTGAIPDTKATSPKWAVERMGDRSMGELKVDSEAELQRDVDATLSWGSLFVQQLETETDIAGRPMPLRDVVYTAVYEKGKISDWADYMHKVTVQAAARLVSQDRQLLHLVTEYIPQEDILFRFARGGESR